MTTNPTIPGYPPTIPAGHRPVTITVWHRQGLAPGTHHLDSDLLDQFLRGYRPGDPIEAVYRYEHGTTQHRTLADLRKLAEQAFRMFNGQPQDTWEHAHTARYYAARNRSLSVGDVLVIGETALSCEVLGWDPTTIPAQAEED